MLISTEGEYMKNQEKRYYPDFKSSILLFFLHVIIIFAVTFAAAIILGAVLGAGGAGDPDQIGKQVQNIIKSNQVYLSMLAVVASALVLTLITIKSREVKLSKFLFKNTEKISGKLMGLIAITAPALALFAGKFQKIIFGPDISNPDLFKAFRGNTAIIFALIMAPIFEEIIFRGIILDGILSNNTVPVAFITATLMFSISHGTLAQLLPTFLAGLFFAFIYYKTRCLILAIFTHFAYNLIPIIGVQLTDFEEIAETSSGDIYVMVISLIILAAGLFGLKKIFEDRNLNSTAT
ncbi:MAG: CPBP family intramembrane metalloprotease [Candidatus Mcinerneyibacterium aminivorans]|uniref:CPBP family intramembrane metalloprotease n=1 Tax=Candidatus Mcinerneyibacterium aminivorans TaxID=2703815 RepID=A0A5D0MBD8_9BACT|nr:MAG: CPBP family intramembrane metalloprotease [Candidatus Mcinerneyibacterium aminivorans]